MADPKEVGELWDQLTASLQTQTQLPLPSHERSSRMILRLKSKPEVTIMPRIQRSVNGIIPVARKAIRQVVTGEAPWPLVFEGDIGTGKTCAALALLDLAGGKYYTTPDFLALIIRSQQGREHYSTPGYGGTLWPEKLWKWLASYPLVVLDELGIRGTSTDPHYECVKQLIDVRFGKPFVVITNLTLEKIGQIYDGRVYSRLAAGTRVEFKGKDRRQN